MQKAVMEGWEMSWIGVQDVKFTQNKKKLQEGIDEEIELLFWFNQ